jgi:two-component system, NtrC family, sensor kinase
MSPRCTAPGDEFPQGAAYAPTLAVPLLREGSAIGAFLIRRMEVKPFPDKQIELVKTFAAQAVIAIENARLLNELRQRTADLTESLEQQTATTEVLRVISNSPGELQSVFQAMLENGVRACGAKFGVLFRYESGMFHPTAMLDVPPAFAEVLLRQGAFAPQPGQLFGRLCESKSVIQVEDRATESHDSPSARYGGARSAIAVPMIKADELVGALFIYRTEVQPFTDKQIELVQNFAAQAVIAIENARLLHELRESLQQQTATADVLKVISSSPGDLRPVFDAMLENAVRICEAKFGVLFRYHGGAFQGAAWVGVPSAYEESLQRRGWFRPDAGAPLDRLLKTGQLIHAADESPNPASPAAVYGGARSVIAVPMRKEEEFVGAFVIPDGSSAVHRQADCASAELRRPGRYRYRECAAAQRVAPAHDGSYRITGAADRHVKGFGGYQPLGIRPSGGV